MKINWLIMLLVAISSVAVRAADENLIPQGALDRSVGFELSGAAEHRYLGDPRRDSSSWGVVLDSRKAAGEVSCVVRGIDTSAGRWFRFTFRGLPQDGFAVKDDDLYMKVAFFGDQGRVSYDAKEKKIYDQIEDARKDLAVNGRHKQSGAEVWRTYQLDFMLPFPQVDQVRVSVGFTHGAGRANAAEFFVDDLRLVRIPDPPGSSPATQLSALTPQGQLIPLGGRWYYDAKAGEKTAPKIFNSSNADHLLYRDAIYSAPFAGHTSAWLRVGNKSLDGSVVKQDKQIDNNVIIEFTTDVMVVHTHGVPNHPTGVFPELGFGNPSYIQEQQSTYYLPLNPRQNPKLMVTATDNSNNALHMGPIGLAVNGVVFFNPFDMGNQDAADLMDRCCGHPNQDNQYHYHKYPICINTPWADEGKGHSAVLGWAFDGVPVYGPYESANVMAKDVKGSQSLNGQNAHYDEARGWHYHVTPGRFPYLIGGFWGVEDSRNNRPPRGRGNGEARNGNDRGPSRDGNGPPGGGPPGRGRPPMRPPPPGE